MCGLAGRFHPTALPDAPGWHARADALLAHRGPDGAGHFRDGRCELVHRRLALIDLTPAGQQPLANETGDIQVVCNGEIYNHHELRRVLECRGHVFRSTSDSEVLVHLYEDRGDNLVDHLRGMFAFAIYDRRRARLLLARDRFGIKPLFYTNATPGGQFVFASEIKAIAALPDIALRADRQACYDFLGLGYIPEPATGFAGIHALAHGTTLVVSAARTQSLRYHRVAAHPQPQTQLAPAVDAAAAALTAAVTRQSVADVPVAALLSGGIDSSLVVAARQLSAGDTLSTFNVRFPESRYDETPIARSVAEHFRTDHHTIDGGQRAPGPDAVFDLMRHFDQPFADTSLVPTYWVAAEVRARGTICTLSGDGGDEAFGGYPRFWQANRLVTLMRSPSWLRQTALRTGTALAGHTRDWGRQLSRAVGLADTGRRDSASMLAGLSSFLAEEQKAALVQPDAREHLLPAARHFDSYRPVATQDLEELSRRLTETLFAVSLPSKMLRKMDMMSMRAGIEVRVPMLDEHMVEVGLALPHRLKTDGRHGKLALRALAGTWLPPHVANHPKHGFSIPLDAMVPASFHEAAADELLGAQARTRPWLNGALVEAWLAGFSAARRHPVGGHISRDGLYQRVFILLALELWLRAHRLTW